MSTSLPSAQALMTHADDPRHLVYSAWVTPNFFPFMRGLLDDLTKQPAQAELAHSLRDVVFAQPSNKGCPCVTLITKLRAAFKAYGERGISLADNQAWSAVSVAMIYFILVTDFHFAAPMRDQMKANHLAQLSILKFQGPEIPAYLLQ
ncbi:hypothetical protein BC827DRAFT_1268531 [Russula dissimulans]|nr:hypothetical protein BC827DRAFT_1268531 [Russula dissimulans]